MSRHCRPSSKLTVDKRFGTVKKNRRGARIAGGGHGRNTDQTRISIIGTREKENAKNEMTKKDEHTIRSTVPRTAGCGSFRVGM
jgi:hypothetical protein